MPAFAHFPNLPSLLTSRDRAVAELALTWIINERFRTVEGLIDSESGADLLNERFGASLHFGVFWPDDIYVRLWQGGSNQFVGRLGAPDKITGQRPLKISSWNRKRCEALAETNWDIRLYEQPPHPKVLHPRFRLVAPRGSLPSEVELATGRSRAAAAMVILSSLRKLMEEAGFPEKGDMVFLNRSPLSVNFTEVRDGIYFSVNHDDPSLRITGYIDPVRPGRYAGGHFHAMTWKRGWEADFFAPGKWTVTWPRNWVANPAG